MSATAGGSPQDVAVASSQKLEKKHKRTKSDHKKKRAREEDDAAVVEETPRKSKKTKSAVADEQTAPPEQPQTPADELPKKKKKKQRAQEEDEEGQDAVTGAAEPKERKKSSKRAKDAEQPEPEPMDVDQPESAPADEDRKTDKKRKEKKSKKQKAEEDEDMKEDLVEADAGAQEKKKRKSKQSSTAGAASQEVPATQESIADLSTDSDFPFFTQTISLYVPFFPVGFDKPLTNVAAQHLDPLLNHYSPVLRGVLLSYSNLNLSDRPAKASLTHPPTDETPALLHSIDEYAVGFGWLTFDAQLFVPSRGKWMEGVVQLQSEGHIGVVCWSKFNASIEAKRMPQGWKWVDLAKGGAKSNASPFSDEGEGEQENQEEDDILDGEELQVVEQIHTTGYWVNEKGKKVNGKLRFRIKNFDVGLAGDYGYLSIEGTCLDDNAEQALAAQERETERARRAKQSGLLRPLSRRVPEFSMTKFGREDQEEDDGKRTVLYKGSRPGTPDD
jgi:DNA-directed RNA polymerase I subunit RPA43